ncbi:hypothetical protein GGR58DRAFT_494908 [Xylaria digitata]|nr:hypothetical protein GGR58DRAFT_494908 [Xylaria digitata]
MPSFFASTLVLAMAATVIGHPLQSRNIQAGANEHLAERNPAENLPIALIESLIGGNRKASAYDEDVAAADPTEVLGKRAQDLPIALIESDWGQSQG